MTTVSPYGEAALLIECDREQVAGFAELLTRELPRVEVIPAATTLLVQLTEPASLADLSQRVQDLLARPLAPIEPVAERVVTIEVRYDGADLASVAAATGLRQAEVVAAHTERPWRVAFGGFAPGFAYLDGGDPRLRVPRLSSPRTVVPAGSVALAGDYCGIYPSPSPGGWQLIGSTSARLWDLERAEPALLRPGWWVQFVVAP